MRASRKVAKMFGVSDAQLVILQPGETIHSWLDANTAEEESSNINGEIVFESMGDYVYVRAINTIFTEIE